MLPFISLKAESFLSFQADISNGKCAGSSVGIATDYGLDESRRGRDFSHTSRLALGPTASCTMGTGSFSGVKRPGRGTDHPPPPRAEVENE
jgi:hypothetical protein